MNKKKISYLIAAVIAVLAIGGIAFGVSRSGSSSNHNAADVTFAQDMIPHHRQAVDMAGYVATRSSNPQVKALAVQIEGAQSPEINQMTGWLKDWSQPVTTSSGHSGGMSGMHGMHGMMSDGDMATLQTLSGAAFDKMWLTMMTEHHSGAIDMAKTELSQGTYADAKALAQSITTSQAAQVTQMKDLLTQL